MKNLFSKIQRADSEFRKKCSKIGVSPWDANPEFPSEAPRYFTTGVTTNWSPSRPYRETETEIQAIINAVTNIADKYKIKPVYGGPCLVAGGAVVMYVGFHKK